jgi:hypothetical protein
MSSDPDKLWKHVAGRLRKEEGLCPPTPEEAQQAYNKAKDIQLSAERLQEIFEAATSDEIPKCEDSCAYPWESESSSESVMEDELALCHNEGDADPEAERLERELQEKMLREDEERDKKT